MELITSKYIKISKLDLFRGVIESTDEKKYKKLKFFQTMINKVMQYEREQKSTITDDIYVSVDILKDSGILDVSNLPVSRQSLLNAILYATFNGDMEMVQKLSALMCKREIMPLELGDMLSYVLEHSMDFDEYMSTECEKHIYNANSKKIEKGYIYSLDKNTKVRKK